MEKQREYPFEFSVVMAVYNVEPFLREAVDSLIVQDFGFENIQLILVDDGSTDGSGAICDKYAAQYPNNVMVIHKENGGASSARNEGLTHVQGRYVNFLDSDDKLDVNTMSAVYDFFQLHEEETDVVAIPMFFFDGQTGEHQLNYKFEKGSRVIDLLQEYSMIQLSMSSTFCKCEVLSDTQFDNNLVFAEDAKCLLTILLRKMKLGVVTGDSISYLYRKRLQGNSALQMSDRDSRWYLPVLRFFHQEIIEYCLKKVGHVPKFVQFTLAYDLQWKIKVGQVPSEIMTPAEYDSYCAVQASLLQHIDDDVLWAQEHIYPEHKLYMLKKKYGKEPYLIKYQDNMFLCYENTAIYPLSRCQTTFEFLEIDSGTCTLEGYTVLFPFLYNKIQLQLEVNGKTYSCNMIERDKVKYALGEPILYHCGFRVSFPLVREDERYTIRFLVVLGGKVIENKNFEFGQFFPVSRQYKNAYYVKDGWRVSATKQSLFIASCGRRGHIKSEFSFCRELWKQNQLGGRKAVLARIAYHVLKQFKRKSIWLISDRLFKADDNGEAFFLYVNSLGERKIVPYFVISKTSNDYKRLSQFGRVVNAKSFAHKLLHLLCDYNISTQADNNTINPFYGYSEAYCDILHHVRSIFLQHGIIQNELKWLNRYSKNLSGFVVSAFPEYDFIANGKYYYNNNELWLTGLPRFDRLYHNEQRYITIMPTWRRYLMASLDTETNIWELNPDFRESDYFTFYNSLLNHTRLLGAAQKYNYRIRFLPHPTMQPHVHIFQPDKSVSLLGLNTKYRDIYAESDLVITDYSSAVFDFAYLRKPIIYCHFDETTFFAGSHVCTRGYFEHERDGFGEVEYDLESAVDRIIEYMENGCQLKDRYRERIDKFFAFNDQSNCQRVYEKIMELDKQG